MAAAARGVVPASFPIPTRSYFPTRRTLWGATIGRGPMARAPIGCLDSAAEPVSALRTFK